MIDLQVNFADISFRNPIIIGSSSLTNRFDKLRDLEKAGAGAAITKLITNVGDPKHHVYDLKARMLQYGMCVLGDKRMNMSTGVKMIKQAKKELTIPIIANIVGESINEESWIDNAKQVEEAGADMIELDLHAAISKTKTILKPIGADPKATAKIVKSVKKKTNIPIMVTRIIKSTYIFLFLFIRHTHKRSSVPRTFKFQYIKIEISPTQLIK